MSERKLGPNTKKLLAHLIALEAIPPGGGLTSGIEFLQNPRQGIQRAAANLEAALAVVKSAPDNPYGDDDEAIAAAILERIEARQRESGDN